MNVKAPRERIQTTSIRGPRGRPAVRMSFIESILKKRTSPREHCDVGTLSGEHGLHAVVGELISKAGLSGDVLADSACGGSHRIPLFCLSESSTKTELCNVDMLIARSGKVKVIVEIEESNVTPIQICGKLLASALCSHFI